MLSPTRLYTVEDVRAMPDDGHRYETISGELFVTPAPSTRHQTVLGRLHLLLGNYVEQHQLGRLWFAPLDVVFGPMTLVEPDMLFVHRDRMAIVTQRDVTGAPDLVIEVLSPGTARTDRGRKRALYQDENISEYCIVDADKDQVELWRPGAMEAAVERETLRWQPDRGVEPLVIELREMFRD